MIAIITAMKIESERVIANMTDMREEKAGHVSACVGRLGGKEAVVCVSGVGKVNAAATTQAIIMKYSPEMIINIGVAGTTTKELGIGDFVVGSSYVQFDVDTSPVGDPKYLISGINKIIIESKKELCDKAVAVARELFPEKKVISGRIASSDKFVGGQNAYLKDEVIALGASCVEMESGAIAHVALLNDVLYIAVRTISDSADGDAPDSFSEFCAASAHNAEAWLMEFIK